MPDSATAPREIEVDVVILGCSFAGIEVLLQLARIADRQPLRIAVIDRQTTHGYLPLVQERLCDRLPGSELSTARFVDSVPGARFVCDEIVEFDAATKVVQLRSGTRVRGRFVVVALGSSFGPPLQLPGRERILAYKDADDYERARVALDRAVKESTGDVPMVVIGGGVSGVELASELVAAAGRAKVTLVSASQTLLPGFHPRVAAKVARVLQKLGVAVELGSRVEAVDAEGVTLTSDGGQRRVAAELVFWAGGVGPAPVLARLGLPRTDDGWLSVGPTLQCFPTPKPSNPDVFACGDAVRIMSGAGRWQTMQRAIECIWQAGVVARNIASLAREPADYPNGVPPLRPHRLRETFFYGVSLGPRSLVVYDRFMLDLPGINHWFRRWLMRQYFARYSPLDPRPAASPDRVRAP